MDTLILNVAVDAPVDLTTDEIVDKIVLALAAAEIDATVEVVDRE